MDYWSLHFRDTNKTKNQAQRYRKSKIYNYKLKQSAKTHLDPYDPFNIHPGYLTRNQIDLTTPEPALPPLPQSRSTRTRERSASSYTETEQNKRRRKTPKPKTFGPGMYKRPFKRPRYKKVPNAAKHGAMVDFDLAGQHQTPAGETLFIGHATFAPERIWQTTCMALIRRLFKQAKIHINNFRDEIIDPLINEATANTSSIVYEYRYRDPGTGAWITAKTSLLIDINATYLAVSTLLASSVRTIYTALSTPQRDTFELTGLTKYPDTTNVYPEARLDLNGAKVTVSCFSKLRMQNVTVAQSETAVDHESVNHVEANPIQGKAYEVDYQNAFIAKTRVAASQSMNGVGTQDYGLIEFETADIVDADVQADFKRPPSRHFFKGVKKQGPCMMNPGDIRQSFLNHTFSVSLNKLVKKLRIYMDTGYASTLPIQLYMGKARMFAWEKSLHTLAADPNLRMHWELHGHLKATVWVPQTAICPTLLLESEIQAEA